MPHYLDSEHRSREQALAFAHGTRYHRKVLVVLAVLALVVVYRMRKGHRVPYLCDNTHAYARSPVGKSVMCVLIAFVAIDVAVDVAFCSWSNRRGWRY